MFAVVGFSFCRFIASKSDDHHQNMKKALDSSLNDTAENRLIN